MDSLATGLGLTLFSALCNAAFAVPLRLRRRFEWENSWVLAFLFAMILLPLTAAELLLPNWRAAIAAVATPTIVIVCGFGFLWGIGSVTFAIGINMVGLSLGYALIMGTIMAVGAVIPMMRKWSDVPGQARFVILLGIAVCVVGVALCGKAGMLREGKRAVEGDSPGPLEHSHELPAGVFLAGLGWCLLSGILSAGNNLGFDFADRVAAASQLLGDNPLFASLARFLPVYWGGFVAVIIFCGLKMLRKGTWKRYAGSGAGRDSVMAIGMGSLHFASQMAYAIAALYFGRLGTTVGFAVMLSTTLILANVFGFLTGEWKMAPKASVRMLYSGLAVLIGAVVLLAYGNSLV